MCHEQEQVNSSTELSTKRVTKRNQRAKQETPELDALVAD
jgi:hypothetical protein